MEGMIEGAAAAAAVAAAALVIVIVVFDLQQGMDLEKRKEIGTAVAKEKHSRLTLSRICAAHVVRPWSPSERPSS
jgi:hypothetical protein